MYNINLNVYLVHKIYIPINILSHKSQVMIYLLATEELSDILVKTSPSVKRRNHTSRKAPARKYKGCVQRAAGWREDGVILMEQVGSSGMIL